MCIIGHRSLQKNNILSMACSAYTESSALPDRQWYATMLVCNTMDHQRPLSQMLNSILSLILEYSYTQDRVILYMEEKEIYDIPGRLDISHQLPCNSVVVVVGTEISSHTILYCTVPYCTV